MASEPPQRPFSKLKLSTTIVTPTDVGLLLRELTDIESALLQLKVRKEGEKTSLPDLSSRMQELVEHNKLNLLHAEDMKLLRTFLVEIKDKAPLMHMSFSTEPSAAFLRKLMVWLRREINPQVLLTIGLQPAIGAGCMLRTTNKYFDMSLRQTFVAQRQMLLEQIVPPASAAAPAAAPVPAEAPAA